MLKLIFFEPTVGSCARQIQPLISSSTKGLVIYCRNAFAENLCNQLGTHVKCLFLDEISQSSPENSLAEINELEQEQILILNEFDPEKLSSILLQFLNATDLTILAPITPHFGRNRPLFLISIPKAGTHLLYKLAQSMGYSPAVTHDGNPTPGNWYCVEYSNSHTVARDFFIDTVRREPFGNRHHPFPRTPTLFIYRNPLDIVVSEANYYHSEGATVFSSYLRHMEFAERLLRLIDDPYLLGSIRDRILNFIPWFDFENVIPISFEELIGSKGNGSDTIRNRLIWSLQLKLHVPGTPESLAADIFDESSPTFNSGRIGSAQELMFDEAISKFFSLNQDFMTLTGYCDQPVNGNLGKKIWDHVNLIPSRSEEFLKRQLCVSYEDFNNTPFNVESGFLDHNIVRFDGKYYALPLSAGAIDLFALRTNNKLSILLSSSDVRSLKAKLINNHQFPYKLYRKLLGKLMKKL